MSLDDDDLQQIATRMLADYDSVKPGLIFSEGFRLELADAWRLQTAVTLLREARGEKVVGYKTGCHAAVNQEAMGLQQPVWGRLWESELHNDSAALTKSDYANLSIEAEFGVMLSRDLKPGMSLDDVAASVGAVYPVLELHNLVLRGDRPHGHELIANNCINCGVVRGEPVTDLDSSRQTDLKLVYDGTTVDEWESLRWPDDIIAGLVWLNGSLTESGLHLKAGDLVLTGAWGPPIPVESCTRVDVTSSAFGDVFSTFR